MPKVICLKLNQHVAKTSRYVALPSVPPTVTLVLLFACTLACTQTSASTPYPDFPYTLKPDPAPLLPSEFDSFSPPPPLLSAITLASSAPAFAEWTRTGNPDETIVTTGNNFSKYVGADAGKDTSFLVYGQTTSDNGEWKDAKLQRLDDSTAALTLSAELPAKALYLIWAKNEAGYSYPVAVNRAEAWWIGPSKASRGATVSVFGRNLSHGGGTTTSWVYIKTAKSAGVWARITKVNSYKVDFVVPADLPDGNYEVWIHNGHGAHYGWSAPVALTLGEAPGWTGPEFNVRNFGAKGDNSTDDEAALQTALQAAGNNPRSTVYFPAGTYMVSRGFKIPANVRWRGDGKNQTIIKLHSNFVKPATYDDRRYSLIFGNEGTKNVEVTELTLDANNNLNGYLDTLIHMRGASEIRFTNVRINAAGYKFFDFHISSLIHLRGCDITGIGGFTGSAKQVFVDSCNFYGTNDANTIFESWGCDGLSVTNSTARDYNNSTATGWAQGRFVYGNGIWGSNRNIYVGDNQTFDFATRPAHSEQNSGEQFLWEGNNTLYTGTPAAAATATTVTLNNLTTNYGDGRYQAVIVKGKGLGQHRQIINFSNGTITVAVPWNLPPDATSTIIIAAVVERAVIYRNNIDGKSDYATRNTASTGVQPYGNSYDFIVDSNTIREVRTGISSWATDEKNTIQPCYFNLYANNIIEAAETALFANVEYGQNMVENPGVSYLGNSFRGNQISNQKRYGILLTGAGAPPGKQLDTTIIERNNVSGAPFGIAMIARAGNDTIANTVIYKNSFTRGATPSANSKGIVITPSTQPPIALRENIWQSFGTIYDGVLPSGVLEAPYRTFAVDGITRGASVPTTLTLWNAGTSPLIWNATDDAGWLTLSSATGMIANEKGFADITLNCDPSKLTAGTHIGTITVSAGNGQKKFTVAFTVTDSSANPLPMPTPTPLPTSS